MKVHYVPSKHHRWVKINNNNIDNNNIDKYFWQGSYCFLQSVKQNQTDILCNLQSMMTHHVMIGVQLLSQLVCEMNQVSEV